MGVVSAAIPGVYDLEVYRKAFANIATQTPSPIASTEIATMPKISARGSAATHGMNGVGRGSSLFAVMGRSPIRSHRSLNVDLILLFFATVRRLICCLPERRFRLALE